MAHPIAEAFLSGPISDADLAPSGISEMTIKFHGRTIKASWYTTSDPCSGDYRSLSLDGKGLPVVGSEAKEIVRAAQTRAKTISSEILASLLDTAS